MPRHHVAAKGDRTRRQILDAAYRLMIRQGYAATSMRQIAARAHLALGGIYNHFSSKAEVFAVIVEERHPFLAILPILNAVHGNSVESFVRNAAHTLVDELGHHPDFLNLMLIEIVEFKAGHLRRLFARFIPLATPLAERIAMLNGNVRPMPPIDLARAFVGMFFSYYITEILIERAMQSPPSSQTLDRFVDIFLHGILVEEAA